jgi:hypothetical protein
MSHYRTVTLPTGETSTMSFEYVVGRHQVKIKGIGIFPIREVGGHDEEVKPSDIVRVILASEKCPKAVRNPLPWDVPSVAEPTKKVDPGPRTRGFAKLCGHEVERVSVAVNHVILYCSDGSRFEIEAELGENRIPTMTCTQTGLSDPSYD